MPERLNGTVLKTVEAERFPRVRPAYAGRPANAGRIKNIKKIKYNYIVPERRGARAVEWDSLENC